MPLANRTLAPDANSPSSQLTLPDHVHQFNARKRYLSRSERFESQHRSCQSFNSSVILFNDVVEVLHLPDLDASLMILIVVFDRCRVGAALVDRDLLWGTVRFCRRFSGGGGLA